MPDWFVACRVDDVDEEDVIPVEHEGCTDAEEDGEYATRDRTVTPRREG